ncbi:mRNA m6A methyltransferase catalytic subunit [Marchantia polymorpha subsp. ruderalis]|uniref:N6-adenosine-methyltransferase MT-A70-like n=2 Tax=Marchantia polymorpha TaxID=3197 RepID=A0AAF6AN33_MARPO|nr:hypothetical protein MARPO_0036s0127 [Marchantia polymorpha]PTQ41154.1 hypothetical protein MARPO_0036s0127 [Marchantia polymorpha]BBM97852.1 hypothetical protein Mp_1g08870 [Marchantia polymorpha subsp. ruderalis]BBM97853.1 hypothetical protein Mp_1g08870 [Marchantia polymorpha subsp. ruderalis]|eukprot:PTQ41153.1 hypothetical protein MARPO_0036s0127 [Marchantia polymorpha]
MEGHDEEENEEIMLLREQRRQLCENIENQRRNREDLINNLSLIVPDLVTSLELSLKVATSFGGVTSTKRERTRYPRADAKDRDYVMKGVVFGGSLRNGQNGSGGFQNGVENRSLSRVQMKANGVVENRFGRRVESWNGDSGDSQNWGMDDWAEKEGGRMEALTFVKGMVAACLLAPGTSVPMDSTGLHRRLSKDPTVAERDALAELGAEGGGIKAVEIALKALGDNSNGSVEIEEFAVSGKTRLMVLGIDRNRLSKELLAPSSLRMPGDAPHNMMGIMGPGGNMEPNGCPGPQNMGPGPPRPDMWVGGNDPHLQVAPPLPGPGPPMFPGGPPPSMVPRGGPRGMQGMMGMPGPGLQMGFGGMPQFQRPHLAPGLGSGPPVVAGKRVGEDDDMKDLENLLNKKSYRELQQSKTGEELLELLHRPTAKETAVAAKFKTKGGSALKEYCAALTKEDCRRQRGSFMACEKVHFRRIIAPHTDSNLGDCSFLDTCRHMKTCKYVHYELDPTQDVRGMMTGVPGLPPPQRPSGRPRRAEYCSDAELGEPQWINCDIRTFRMDVLGQFGVIMADPPWDIHMELPYGTMADDEMRNLNVPALQTDGLIFLWVTGRAMELGRECLELWGYRRVEEMIWVKTNQLQRIIRTGRTGHWLNHSKEHCLVGIKGNPDVNRNIDTDVIVAEVRETSRKPDEMYPLLERISPRTRKLELFARMHNTHAGWISLGNQLNGVRLVDEELRARFKSAYPEVEVQPPDPPSKVACHEGENSTPRMKSPPHSASLVKENGEGNAGVATVSSSGNTGGDEKMGSDKDSEAANRQDDP